MPTNRHHHKEKYNNHYYNWAHNSRLLVRYLLFPFILEKLTNAHNPKRSFYASQEPRQSFPESKWLSNGIAAVSSTLPTRKQKSAYSLRDTIKGILNMYSHKRVMALRVQQYLPRPNDIINACFCAAKYNPPFGLQSPSSIHKPDTHHLNERVFDGQRIASLVYAAHADEY